MLCECCKEREAEQYYNNEEMFVCNYCLDDFLNELETVQVNKVGRPSIGDTKKVSITLTEEDWKSLDSFQTKYNLTSRSQLLRIVIRDFIQDKVRK